jgi:hypothetical protein
MGSDLKEECALGEVFDLTVSSPLSPSARIPVALKASVSLLMYLRGNYKSYEARREQRKLVLTPLARCFVCRRIEGDCSRRLKMEDDLVLLESFDFATQSWEVLFLRNFEANP